MLIPSSLLLKALCHLQSNVFLKKSIWKTKEEGIIFHFFERVFPGFLTFIFPEELDGSSDLIRDVVKNKALLGLPYRKMNALR